MTMSPRIVQRAIPERAAWRLENAGVHPLLARLYAARGVVGASELKQDFSELIAPDGLKGIDAAASVLADAIASHARVLVIADYDCDGATACAVAVRGLRALGAEVDYLVPNRFETGYGLTPELVDLAAPRRPDLLVTVDNGIASVAGVRRAHELGITTVITDHHLPGANLPAAAAIVNPNQPGCPFPSKHLAGVGVMFYVLLALRAELRRRGAFDRRAEPNFAVLADLVALGTVADVVRLDPNNRILVAQGLQRIRRGRMQPGLRALFAVAGKDPARASATDLGFMIGPRVNAAGRLTDMRVGIECLLAEDYGQALALARELDQLNRARREIVADMEAAAETLLAQIDPGERASLCLFQPDWHAGVVGLIAGRVKERFNRPTIAFAPGQGDEIKGSGRSIPGLHLRDALDRVAKREPDLLQRFGGHAMAAGLSLCATDYPRFVEAFEVAVRDMLDPAALESRLETDGTLEEGYYNLPTARLLDEPVWGQGFPAPLFADRFEVDNQRLLNGQHLKLRLLRGSTRVDAIWFRRSEPLPPRIHAAFRLSANEYQGLTNIQLVLEGCEAAR